MFLSLALNRAVIHCFGISQLVQRSFLFLFLQICSIWLPLNPQIQILTVCIQNHSRVSRVVSDCVSSLLLLQVSWNTMSDDTQNFQSRPYGGYLNESDWSWRILGNNPLLQNTTVKLDGSNYLTWSRSAIAIQSRGLYRF